MEGTTGRPYDRTPLLVGGAIAVLIALVAAVDFRSVVEDVPPVPPPCEELADSACQASRSAALGGRLERAQEVEDDYEARGWAYGVGALAAILVGAGVALTRTAAGQRRELFTDLGVAAVVWLLAGFGLELVAEGEIVDIPSRPIFFPGLALLPIAAVGTLVTRRPETVAGAPAPSREPRGGPAVRAIGFGLTAVAVVSAAIAFGERGDPCANPVSDAVETLVGVAWISAGVAALLGLASLIQRRWLAALIMLTVGPFAAVVAAFASACWN